MKAVTFITGNEAKAAYVAKFLGMDIKRVALDLDELQSLDANVIIEHKARQAYEELKTPVLVDDVSLRFEVLGKLPGPLIKWFLEEIKPVGLCKLLDGYDSRRATAEISMAYFDGADLKIFTGSVTGTISSEPLGTNGHGWDRIFIPDGTEKTYGQMDDQEIEKYGVRTTTILPRLREFLLDH